MKNVLLALCAVVLTVGLASAQTFGTSGTTTLSVTVGAEASIQINTATTNLTIPGATTIFDNFTGSTSFTYKIRTTKTGGTGKVQLQITSDFVGAAGGSGPLAANNDLTYACSVSAPATTAGTQTISTSSAKDCATFGANAHSANAGTGSNTVNWTLTNKPTFETDTYQATATFTISAT